MTEIRLQKYLANCGIASRRKSEEIIKQGKVKINNKTVTELGVKIEPKKDVVYLEGKKIELEKKKVYIILNKPEGYITTAKEQFNRPNVMDLLKDIKERVYPVGRLDMDTSGLLLLTNDGDLSYKLTHPKYHINKTYIAEIKGVPNSNKINKFQKGLEIEDYITLPSKIKLLKVKKKSSIVEIIIQEGKNRQVKKMCNAIGHPVIKLKRVAIGKLKLRDLDEGKWKYLTKTEIKLLKGE